VTLPRLLLRIAVLIAVLVVFDVWAGKALGDAGYADAYRMPLELPTAALPGYVHAIDARRSADSTQVLFLGASPTWGYRTKDSKNTFPYAYASAAASSGVDLSAANLATNGQLLGDQYLLAKATVREGDVVFVQLTYHMFDPRYQRGDLVRYPEIAQLPGVSVSADEAASLGVPENEASTAADRLDRVLFDTWRAYRERSAIASKLFGGMPEDRLRAAWRKATEARPPTEQAEEQDIPKGDFVAFDALDPEKQMVVISQYAENASFTVSPDSPQIRTLRSLADLLKERNAKAVFFVAPLNRDILDYYGVIDRAQYTDNSETIGDVARSAGFGFIDYNLAEAPVFGPQHFADIDHTTDEGGRAVGQRLFEDTAAYLRGGRDATLTWPGESP
jgi:lysophospholipase L1-like esterase